MLAEDVKPLIALFFVSAGCRGLTPYDRGLVRRTRA
jgi:hypothetical protein